MTSRVDSTSHPKYSKLLNKLHMFLTDMMFIKHHLLDIHTLTDCNKIEQVIQSKRKQVIVFKGKSSETYWNNLIDLLESIN